MRDQVEERLKFYDTGDAPRKNVDVMSAVADSLRKIAAKSEKPAKKSKKSLSTEDVVEEEEVEGKKEKKDKKEKKRDRESIAPVEEEVVADSEGKKKKKKKVRPHLTLIDYDCLARHFELISISSFT